LVYPVRAEPEAQVVARLGSQIVGVQHTTEGKGSLTFLGFRPRDDQAASLGYETRTWFDILNTLGAYPKSQSELAVEDNPAVVSRESPYLATRFPNGTTAVAVHYRRHIESWPGGFHRDAKQDTEILAKNPLDSDELDLHTFRVNGYAVDYRGRLIVAFRLNERGSLEAFAGYDCASIRVNGRNYAFGTERMTHVAWAPVEERRRVAGGALLEIWAHGTGALSIPVPQSLGAVRLIFQGARPGAVGESIPAQVHNGLLQFQAEERWPQKHLYVLASA
jgi:hypothetical protein